MTRTPPPPPLLVHSVALHPQPSETPVAFANVPEQAIPRDRTPARLSPANRRPAPCLGPSSRSDFSFSGKSARDPELLRRELGKFGLETHLALLPWRRREGAVRAVGLGFPGPCPQRGVTPRRGDQQRGARRPGGRVDVQRAVGVPPTDTPMGAFPSSLQLPGP